MAVQFFVYKFVPLYVLHMLGDGESHAHFYAALPKSPCISTWYPSSFSAH